MLKLLQFSHITQVGSKSLVETLQEVEDIVSNVAEVLPQSSFFSMVLKSCSAFSLHSLLHSAMVTVLTVYQYSESLCGPHCTY